MYEFKSNQIKTWVSRIFSLNFFKVTLLFFWGEVLVVRSSWGLFAALTIIGGCDLVSLELFMKHLIDVKRIVAFFVWPVRWVLCNIHSLERGVGLRGFGVCACLIPSRRIQGSPNGCQHRYIPSGIRNLPINPSRFVLQDPITIWICIQWTFTPLPMQEGTQCMHAACIETAHASTRRSDGPYLQIRIDAWYSRSYNHVCKSPSWKTRVLSILVCSL